MSPAPSAAASQPGQAGQGGPSQLLHVTVAHGQIEYKDAAGHPQVFHFQCNPTSLTRSRTITRVDTKAGNSVDGTTDKPGMAGRKYSHKPSPWRFDSLELWFDASMPYSSSGSVSAESEDYARNLAAIKRALEHLEAISEPGAVARQNDSQHGAPPAPSPPEVTLRLGDRVWKGHVNSVSILEKDFTKDLIPKQVKATLSLELTVSRRQADQNKLGASQNKPGASG